MNHWFQEIFYGKTQSLVHYLCHKFSVGKGIVYASIKDKKILINGSKINTSYRVKHNDEITIKYPLNQDIVLDTMDPYQGHLPLKNLYKYRDMGSLLDSMVFYENENFMVINKPIHWATQDGTNNPYNLDDLLTFFQEPHYLVHRLDKDTSGLLLVAKNRQWAKILTGLMAQGAVIKEYLAMTPHGPHHQWEGVSYIHEDVAYNNDYQPNSKTIFTKIKDMNGGYSLWNAQLITGKKHQIRIHCKLAGIPIIGDEKYHGLRAHRLHLHSYRIKFFYEKNYEFTDVIGEDPWKL
jgi:23S rRNA pseudouridine955/2504/2580 synthase